MKTDFTFEPSDAAYRAEYAKDRDYYVKHGTTEEQYVLMRRIDEGKVELQAGSDVGDGTRTA